MFDELATFVTRYRRWLIGLSIAVSLGCAATYPQLEFDFSPQQFFHTDSKLGKFRDEFARTFAREDNLMLVAIEGDDVFEPRVLGTLRNLTLELQSLETVERADSVATFRIPRPGGGPGELTVEPLLEQTIRTRPDGTDRPVPDASAEKLASLAEREPLVHGRFVSKDGRAAAILVWLDREIQAVQKLRDAIDAIEGRLEKHPLPDGYDYRLGGVPPLRVEIVSSLQAEQSLFIPLNALIFVLVLWFLFRRPAGVVLPLGVVVMAVSGTVAMLVATGSSIDIVSNVLPTLIFVIGIADSIHMVTRHAQAAQTGLDRVEAAREAVRHTGFACLMTSTTTAVGFISLVTADSALLVDFGWQAAAGVMLAYVFTLFFLPAGLASMQPVQSTPGGNSGSSDSIQRGLTGLARRVLARPRITVAAGLTIAIGFGVAAYQWVRIDEKLMSVFQRNHPAYRDVEFMEQKFGGFLPVEVSISSPKR
ncbi:MAG: RND family transporter, partial [Bradymonadaceae bacterium]